MVGEAAAGRVRAWSYLDDVVIAAPPAVMEEAITRTGALLQETGYKPAWEAPGLAPGPSTTPDPGLAFQSLVHLGNGPGGSPPGGRRSVGSHLRALR
eukprot:11763773-Alexandrium_andersonii.AAC.1